MERIKKVFSAIHFIVWLLLFLIFCLVLKNEGYSDWLYLSVLILLASLSVFYSHFFILTRYRNRKRHGLYLSGLACILLLGPFLYLWFDAGEISDWQSFREQYFTTLFSFVIFFVILSWIARLSESWFTNSLKQEILEKQAVQAELAYLKSQINPHFLFNILNNIHTLAYTNSSSTATAIMRLSSLMRYMLYESNAGTVALEQEIRYLQDFINLQQLRFSADSVVDFKIEGDPESCSVTPLLFIHLLENAYKHSPAKLKTGDIKVKISINKDDLEFRISNPVVKKANHAILDPGGLGLANITKRLRLLYHDSYTFEVRSDDTMFNVTLVIPLHIRTDER